MTTHDLSRAHRSPRGERRGRARPAAVCPTRRSSCGARRRRRSPTRFARSPFAARPRSASRRRTGSRSRRSAARISTRPTTCSPRRARRRSTSAGRSTSCATTPRPSARVRCTQREVERCRRMGTHAVDLVPAGARLLTHCNTGALATGGYGSALGAVRAAWDAGLVEHVWVDETRPLLQGARLTAWELEALGIPFSVIVDGAAASLMACRRGGRRVHRSGSHRGERRRREQGRDVRARRRGEPSRSAVLRRRTDLDARSEPRVRRRHPDRGARRGARSRRAFPPATRRSTSLRPRSSPRSSPRSASIARRTRRRFRSRLRSVVIDVDRGDSVGPRAVRLRRAALRVAAGASRVGRALVRVERRAGRDRAAARRRDHAAAGGRRCRATRQHERRGSKPFARGEVAQVVLAGGMATRFGGVVKAVLDGGRRKELPRGEAAADRRARARARRRRFPWRS